MDAKTKKMIGILLTASMLTLSGCASQSVQKDKDKDDSSYNGGTTSSGSHITPAFGPAGRSSGNAAESAVSGHGSTGHGGVGGHGGGGAGS